MTYPWAVPGKQVVCIRDDWVSNITIICPRKDTIYTIRDAQPYEPMLGGVELWFEEIRNPVQRGCTAEPSFAIAFFRPCRPTSIEDLERLRNPTPSDMVEYFEHELRERLKEPTQ